LFIIIFFIFTTRTWPILAEPTFTILLISLLTAVVISLFIGGAYLLVRANTQIRQLKVGEIENQLKIQQLESQITQTPLTSHHSPKNDPVFQSNLLQALLDSSVQAYVLLDTNYKVLNFNKIAEKQIEELFNHKIEKEKNILDYFSPENSLIFQKAYQQAIKRGNIFEREYGFRQKYVGKIFWDVRLFPVYGENNKILGVAFSILDISRNKRALEQIRIKKDQLEVKNQELSQINQIKNKLFSIIAHDFRSPLSTLKAALSSLESGDFDEEEQAFIYRELNLKLDYTLQAMENLLYWAKSQMQGLDLKPKSLVVKDLVIEVFNFSNYLAHSKDISLLKDIAPDMLVKADADVLKIILRNLIANAIKFTPTKGRIEVKSFARSPNNDKVIIEVIDNGVGIKPENLKKLFQQNNFSTKGTANEHGTGLGLMICKDFVELQGGKIWVESEENKGSKFSIELPIG
jgi:PAS domain S-box-containing protein